MTYAEQSHEYTREYQRALWRWCAETVASRLCDHSRLPCPTRAIRERLLAAIDNVPDLGVFIRKTEPDIPSFEESRMTREQLYGR